MNYVALYLIAGELLLMIATFSPDGRAVLIDWKRNHTAKYGQPITAIWIVVMILVAAVAWPCAFYRRK